MGAFLAAASVAIGAVGAHLIRDWVAGAYPDEAARRLDIWDTASRYQMYMAIGLMISGLWEQISIRQRTIVGATGVLGAILFSGCLIVYVIMDIKPLMAIVPIGGFCMIASWTLLGWFTLTSNKLNRGE